MYIRLNLATKPLISHRPFLAGAAIAALVGGILFAILGWRFYTLRQADANLRSARDRGAPGPRQIHRRGDGRQQL
jgi:hypothetical protein